MKKIKKRPAMITMTGQDKVLASTLSHLKNALQEWDKIPDGEDSPVDELMKKTRELVKMLSKKIDDLDL